MKKTIIIVNLLLLTGCVEGVMEEPFIQNADSCEAEEVRTRVGEPVAYYWYHDQKIYLPIDENNHFAIFRESTLETLPMLSSLNAGIEFKDYNFNASSTRGETEEKFFWAKVDSEIAQAYSDEIVYLAPYLVGSSNDLGVTDRFYVKLKSEMDYALLNEFANENGAEIVNDNFMPLWYTCYHVW